MLKAKTSPSLDMLEVLRLSLVFGGGPRTSLRSLVIFSALQDKDKLTDRLVLGLSLVCGQPRTSLRSLVIFSVRGVNEGLGCQKG